MGRVVTRSFLPSSFSGVVVRDIAPHAGTCRDQMTGWVVEGGEGRWGKDKERWWW